MDQRVAEWLASGDTGTSSTAIMLWLSARLKDKTWGPSTPSDSGDLGRCLRLLERIPEWRERMPEMAEAGGLWPTFSKYWPELERAFLDDCGGKLPGPYQPFNCSKTNALMRRVHDEAYAADKPNFTEVRFDSGKLKGCSVRFSKDDPLGAAFEKMTGDK